MFKMLESLTKAAVGVVAAVTVDPIADVITLGGAMTEQDKPYTAQRLEGVMKNLNDATK